MSLVAGSVTVNGAGVASGTGFAKQMYDALEADTDFQGLTGAKLQKPKQQLAAICNAAAALITYVKANAQVSTTDSGTAPIAWTGTGSGTLT